MNRRDDVCPGYGHGAQEQTKKPNARGLKGGATELGEWYATDNYRPELPGTTSGRVIADLYDKDGIYERTAVVADCGDPGRAIRYCGEQQAILDRTHPLPQPEPEPEPEPYEPPPPLDTLGRLYDIKAGTVLSKEICEVRIECRWEDGEHACCEVWKHVGKECISDRDALDLASEQGWVHVDGLPVCPAHVDDPEDSEEPPLDDIPWMREYLKTLGE